MDSYENYSPDIPVSEELPPASEVLGAPAQTSGRKRVRSSAAAPAAKRRTAKTAAAKEASARPDFELASKIKAFATSQNLTIIVGLFLGGIGVWLLIAFLSYLVNCISDQAIVNNSAIGEARGISNVAGEGGARLSEFLINETFGLGSAVLIFWLLAMSVKLLLHWPRFKTVNFTVKCFVALITLSLIVGLATIGMATPVNWGGYHGRYVNEWIMQFVGWPGAAVLSLVMVCIFFLICLRDLWNWLMKLKRQRDDRRRQQAELRAEQERVRRQLEEMQEREMADAAVSGEDLSLANAERGEEDAAADMGIADFPSLDSYAIPDIDDFDPGSSYQLDEKTEEEAAMAAEDVRAGIEEPQAEVSASEPVPGQPPIQMPNGQSVGAAAQPEVLEAGLGSEGELIGQAEEDAPVVDGSEPMVVNVNQVAVADKVTAPKSGSLYRFPEVSLLRPGTERISVDADEQAENKEKIRKTLLDFDIPITSIEATVGPTVTLYEIRPERGVKISKIRNLVDDLALSLSAKGVRIIAPIPGKGTVGIEVANKDPMTVSMQTVIKSRKYQETKAKLPLAIGSTISNEVYIGDLAKMPHLLVAGATGQGKSVGLNAIIASLLYRKSPQELKFVMVDPKMVEFSLYAKIENHYLAKIPDCDEPIITDMGKVVATLSSLCVEMDDRYQLLKQAQVRNLEEYNTMLGRGELDPSEGHRFMPYIVVIVDEFSDLIMMSGKEVEIPIARLAQKARAVGMHVIIATQRPSTNVITGIIKANFPVRMAFKVSSGVDSKTILDTTGAQQLIGKGDMLISNNSEMVRVQCAFIDTPEVQAICNHIASQPGATGAYILPEPKTTGSEDGGASDGSFGGDYDPLLPEVARIIIQSNTASTSNVQRRFSIGYNRAGKIMDQLEALGVVGPATGGKPRQVLTDPATLDAILNSI